MPSTDELHSRPIRLALTLLDFDTGGLERCAANLINLLPRDRYQPTLICCGHFGSAARWLERNDLDVVELHRPCGIGPLSKAIADSLRERRIDILHTHNWATLVEGCVARWRSGTPVHVHVEHGADETLLGKRGLSRVAHAMVKHGAFRALDKPVVVGESLLRQASRTLLFPGRRIEVLPNGVVDPMPPDAALKRDLRRRYRAAAGCRDEHEVVIGFVGRLAPVKGLELVIETLAELERTGRRCRLLFVGDGPERTALEEVVARQGVTDSVHFAGHDAEVGGWLQAMDLFINCSHSEGMSLAVQEALGAGLPVVATHVGDTHDLLGTDPQDAARREADGARALLEASAGVLVRGRNPAHFAQALARLIDDPDRRASVGRRARERFVERYDVLRMVHRYDELYRRCLGLPLTSAAATA